MKTLLDLIQEYAVLNEAKTLAGGVLPPDEEERWRELKAFYDTLMMQEGFCERPVARYSTEEIRRQVTTRTRLRVRTDMEVIVQHQSSFSRARVGNLSCGGALLLCDDLFEVGSRLTLHLTDIARRRGILWAESVVVWYANRGADEPGPHYRMGVRFVALEQNDWSVLDSYVVENIENRILSMHAEALSPNFVRREQLML